MSETIDQNNTQENEPVSTQWDTMDDVGEFAPEQKIVNHTVDAVIEGFTRDLEKAKEKKAESSDPDTTPDSFHTDDVARTEYQMKELELVKTALADEKNAGKSASDLLTEKSGKKREDFSALMKLWEKTKNPVMGKRMDILEAEWRSLEDAAAAMKNREDWEAQQSEAEDTIATSPEAERGLYGTELTNLETINIDSQEGRLNYLTSLAENNKSLNSERLGRLEAGLFDDVRKTELAFSNFSDGQLEYLEGGTRRAIELADIQKTILGSLDFSKSSVIAALREKTEDYQKKMTAPGMNETATNKLKLMHEAADSLYKTMVAEVSRRKQVPAVAPETQAAPTPTPEAQTPPASYTMEKGLANEETTMTVGQEIPAGWFESIIVGQKNPSGFGITIERPPQIEHFLSSILNNEYVKISETDRQKYNYLGILKKLKEEARRTRKIPDIAAIIKSSREP